LDVLSKQKTKIEIIMKISSFTIIVLFLSLALAGLALVPLLPVKLSPSYSLPQLTISYSMSGHSSRVIEMKVTSHLEAMLSRVKGVQGIRSTSGNGWGKIIISLDQHTDIDAARFEISTIIRQIWPELPNGLSYPIVRMNHPDNNEIRPFISYTIHAMIEPIFIQHFAENYIKPRLAGIRGVYRIDISGATPMEWQLEYDNRQLSVLGITIDDIRKSINCYYQKEFLGIVNHQENDSKYIRLAFTPNITKESFEPAAIFLAGKNGKIYRLDQLLKITRCEEAPQSYYRINGLNSVYLSVYADETANQLRLSDKVKQEIADIVLPQGYEIHNSYDATEYINNELNRIYMRTALTIVILLFFVLLITQNIRYLLLIVTSLMINLCIAMIFYYMLKLEIQFYSLAGITISLSLIIDNTIVMSDHIKNRHNRNAFLPIFAATMTTIGALVIIFFLDETIRLNLQDFAAVVIVNLTVSLLVALLFVPAMIDKMNMFRKNTKRTPRLWMKRIIVYLSRYYLWQIHILIKRRVWTYIVLIFVFGLPVFMLPEKLEKKNTKSHSKINSLFIETYNRLFDNEIYKKKVKPIVDKTLGGSLRLFIHEVYNDSYFINREATMLSITASLPNGSTLQQMNNLIIRMESYLITYKEIHQFQTNIYNARQARIDIFFTKEAEKRGFPYTLKSRVIDKARELGGASWIVFGLQDQAFNNTMHESAGNHRIEIFGYNYDELYSFAEQLKEKLLSYRRVKNVLIRSEFTWWKDDYQEFYFYFDKMRLARENIRPSSLFASITPILGKNIDIGTIVVDNEIEKLKLTSRQSEEYDIWSMQYIPLCIRNQDYKLSELMTIEKSQMPQEVFKINQQYRLCLQYEYTGTSNQWPKVQDNILEEFNVNLPIGYSTKSEISSHNKNINQYFLLLLVIVIIFFTTSILFNSIKQPLAVIGVIPISYIGVFMTFYLFKLNFDQGGFASFVLLCGVTVNASIYILNEYNQIRIRKPLMSSIQIYLKAWNSKITPMFLTVISTVLGFIPFLIGEEKEAFWFPLAAGTIGGLLMSIIGIFLYLPVFLLRKK
jgi:multidrug efflux pump subunit AcrB